MTTNKPTLPLCIPPGFDRTPEELLKVEDMRYPAELASALSEELRDRMIKGHHAVTEAPTIEGEDFGPGRLKFAPFPISSVVIAPDEKLMTGQTYIELMYNTSEHYHIPFLHKDREVHNLIKDWLQLGEKGDAAAKKLAARSLNDGAKFNEEQKAVYTGFQTALKMANKNLKIPTRTPSQRIVFNLEDHRGALGYIVPAGTLIDPDAKTPKIALASLMTIHGAKEVGGGPYSELGRHVSIVTTTLHEIGHYIDYCAFPLLDSVLYKKTPAMARTIITRPVGGKQFDFNSLLSSVMSSAIDDKGQKSVGGKFVRAISDTKMIKEWNEQKTISEHLEIAIKEQGFPPNSSREILVGQVLRVRQYHGRLDEIWARSFARFMQEEFSTDKGAALKKYWEHRQEQLFVTFPDPNDWAKVKTAIRTILEEAGIIAPKKAAAKKPKEATKPKK